MHFASFILCAHNPRPDFFQRVLEGCRNQENNGTKPQIVIVDSASTPRLTKLSSNGFRDNVIRSEIPGLAIARILGIRQTFGNPIVFVDDDTVLSSNYLAEAQRILAERPYLGAIGGQLIPEFEGPLPLDASYYRRYLAIREFQTPQWSNQWNDFATSPIGGGMVVRRNVAEAWADRTETSSWRIGLGRNGRQLSGGEDIDLLQMACEIGYGKGIFPELILTHLIPAKRLTADFLVQIFEGNCRSSAYLEAMLNQHFTTPPSRLRHRAKLLVEACLMRSLDRRLYFAQERGRRAGWLQAMSIKQKKM